MFANYTRRTRCGLLMRRHSSYLNAVELVTVNGTVQATTDYNTEKSEDEAAVDLSDNSPATGENRE